MATSDPRQSPSFGNGRSQIFSWSLHRLQLTPVDVQISGRLHGSLSTLNLRGLATPDMENDDLGALSGDQEGGEQRRCHPWQNPSQPRPVLSSDMNLFIFPCSWQKLSRGWAGQEPKPCKRLPHPTWEEAPNTPWGCDGPHRFANQRACPPQAEEISYMQ